MADRKISHPGKKPSKQKEKRPLRSDGSGSRSPKSGVRGAEQARQAHQEVSVGGAGLHKNSQELFGAPRSIEMNRRRYRELFEFAPLAYFVTDLTGTIREANTAAAALLNVPQDILIGKPLADYVTTEEGSDFPSRLLQLERADETQAWELGLRTRQGDVLDGEIVVTPIRSEIDVDAVVLLWVVRDITPRKLVEKKTQTLNAESGLRILERITDSYISLDREWRFTDVNPAAERTILRRPKQELLGQVIWSAFPHTVGKELQRQCEAALAEDRPAHFEAEWGETGQWFEMHAYPTRDGVSVFLRDISERKREEEVNARLVAIIESSDDAIIGLTTGGNITSWNPGAERLFGFSAEEVNGKPISMLYPPDFPDEFPRIMMRLKRGEQTQHDETVRMRRDGTRIEVAVSLSPIRGSSGEVIGAAKIVRDITAQKRAREAEHFLVEAGAVLASSLDYAATLQSVARLTIPFLADYCVIDLVEADESLRQVASAAVSPAQEQLLDQWLLRYPGGGLAMGARQVLQSGLPRVMFEMPDSSIDGTAQDAELVQILRQLDPKSFMIVPMIARGRTLGAIWLGMASPSRRYQEADLKVAEDLARLAAFAVDNARLYIESQAAVTARDQFLSLASHEVRTPLTVIQGYTQLLRQQAEQAETTPGSAGSLDLSTLLRALQNIEYSSGRLEALMNDLLDITRLPSGVLTISPERVNLSELLLRVIESVRAQKKLRRRSSRIDLRVEIVNEDIWGKWDRVRLEQVFTNLIDNAVKYSPANEMISIRLAVEDGAGPLTSPCAHLVVRDRGIGIPTNELGTIFRPFVRASNAIDRQYPGLGIGLAVSKEIVSRHGGRIWVESNGVDQGSAFHVVLPLAES